MSLKETWKESPEAVIGLGFWGIFFTVIFLSLMLGRPGPDKGTPVCAYDETTIHYIMTVDSGGEHIPMRVKRSVKVGERGGIFEKLESLTPMPDGSYQAKYRNIVTDKTAVDDLLKCPDSD